MALVTLADRYDPRLDVMLIPDFAIRAKARLMQAPKMILDERASIRFGEFVRDNIKWIARNAGNARPGLDLMYVEYDYLAFFKAMTGDTLTDREDDRTGYLFDGASVKVMTHNKYDNFTSLWFLGYLLGTKDAAWKDVIRMVPGDPTDKTKTMNFLLWGAAQSELTKQEADIMLENHSVELLDIRSNVIERLSLMIPHSIGDMRNIVGLLLLLGEQATHRVTERVEARRTFVKGKSVRLSGYTTITLNDDFNKAATRTSRFGHSSGGLPKGYEVLRRRGSWVRNKVAVEAELAGCDHDWRHADQDHAECWFCHGKRFWRSGINKDQGAEKAYRVTAPRRV